MDRSTELFEAISKTLNLSISDFVLICESGVVVEKNKATLLSLYDVKTNPIFIYKKGSMLQKNLECIPPFTHPGIVCLPS